MGFPVRNHALCCVTLAVSMVTAGRLRGQGIEPWAVGFEQPLVSSVDQRVIELLQAALPISEEQRAAAAAVLDDHEKRFEGFVSEARPVKTKHDQIVRRLPGGSIRKLHAETERERVLAEVADRQADLDNRALDELKALLSERQL